MNHIILIGFMGAGKTSIGKRLAKKLNLEFVDTDELIEEQAHMEIQDIFREHGEAYFRNLETLTLRQLLGAEKRMIISVGGGLPMEEANRPLLKELGYVIYLKAQVQTLLYRLQGDTKRPMIQGGDLKEKVEDLMGRREVTYEEVSRFILDTDKKSLNKVVDEIEEHVG